MSSNWFRNVPFNFKCQPTFFLKASIVLSGEHETMHVSSRPSRVASKYGTKFYWQENGEEASISNAVSAIDSCLREAWGVPSMTLNPVVVHRLKLVCVVFRATDTSHLCARRRHASGEPQDEHRVNERVLT